MGERLLLQFAHDMVRALDRRRHPRPITMLRLNGLGEPGIVGAKLKFERAAAHREAPLDLLKARLLPGIKLEMFMEQIVEFSSMMRRMENLLPDEHARHCREKGDRGDPESGGCS